MNAHVSQFFTLIIVFILTACAPAQIPATSTSLLRLTDVPPVTTLLPTRTPLPTSTVPPPTLTPLLTASPTPEQVIEPVTIPECIEDGTGDTRNFNELLESLWPELMEMDSFRYRTLYRYSVGDHYAEDELSAEVAGAHRSRLTSPVEGYFSPLDAPFETHSYERSQVVLTDLRTGMRTETIVTEEGFWAREAEDPSWIAFDPAAPADMFNVAETFSPWMVMFMVRGGGSFAPGVWAEAPVMAQAETLGIREVMHRCWIPSPDNVMNAYLQTGIRRVVTFLSNAEVHLWTTKDDTQLVRLVLTGDHIGERLGAYEEWVMHDMPSDFLLRMEISDVGAPVEIEPPVTNQVALTIPVVTKPAADISAPYNDLPLPADAKLTGVFGEEENYSTIPREYWLTSGGIGYDALHTHFNSNWYDIPADRRPLYETKLSLSNAAAYYLNEMGQRSWQLKQKSFQAGLPVLYLFFEREGLTLPVIIETKTMGGTLISAILPPGMRVLPSPTPQLLTPTPIATPMPTPGPGWTRYTNENSGLISDDVSAVAVDKQGRLWVGQSNGYFGGQSGLSVLDPGGGWTTYTLANSDWADERINALAIDAQDRVWMGTASGLSVLGPDGAWKTYTPDSFDLEADASVDELLVDSQGRLWMAHSAGLSVLAPDGKWGTYTPEDSGLDGDDISALAQDKQERIWIGTDEGVSILAPDSQWTNYTETDLGLTGEYVGVTALEVDEQDRTWIGSSGGGLVVLAPDGSRTTYTSSNSDLAGDYITALFRDERSRLWVGTEAGLSVLTPDSRWESYTPANPAFISSSLAVDGYGRVWIGTEFGLMVFVPSAP